MSPGFMRPPNYEQFFEQVWEIVRQIPSGKVCTYGQIAGLIPPPGSMNLKDYDAFGARWVGSAMANCPGDVPWQRVINSQGKISLNREEGQNVQRQLLEAEGVQFDEKERGDLKRYRWSGPPTAWLREHGLSVPPERDNPQQGSLGI